MNFLTVTPILITFAIFVMSILVAFCPEGYEDDKGFHYGKVKKD